MKKRILSMLLLVVMLVTALPLSVIPSLAVEDEEETQIVFDREEYDAYNALYVQNGLTQAFDVMSLNSYWGEDVNARAEFPKDPMTYTDYEHGGKTYNFTDHYQRYDFETDYYLVYKVDAAGKKTIDQTASVTIEGTAYKNYQQYTDPTLAKKGTKVFAETLMATEQGKNASATFAVVERTAGVDGYDYNGYELTKTVGEVTTTVASYRVEGPYRATLVKLTKDATTGKYTAGEDLLASYVFDTVENAKAKARELAKVTEPNAEGGYQTGNSVYFVVGIDINDAHRAAASAYYPKVNAWLKEYSWIGAGLTTSTYPTTAIPSKRRYQSFGAYAAVEDPQPGQGYLVRSHYHAVDGALNFSVSSLTNSGTSGTTELTTRIGAKAAINFFMFHNLRPNVSGNNVSSITYFTAATDPTVAAVTKNPMNRDTVDTLRFTVKNNADTDFISLEQGTTTIYSANGTYGGTDGNNMIGYSNSFIYGEIYNLRSYNRALSKEEAAQNHFADLMKWYRIDIDLVNRRSEERRVG